MGTTDHSDENVSAPLLDPPQSIHSNTGPEQVDRPKRSIMTRPGFGTSGRCINLVANHFKVSLKFPDEIFYQYSV